MASRLCPVYSSTAELRAQANVITDENLLSKIEKEVEKYVENLRSRNMTIPEETLQLLEALRNRRGDVALLEVVVEVRNRGPEAISIYGPAPCGPIIDFIASNATGRERWGNRVCSSNGNAYRGLSVCRGANTLHTSTLREDPITRRDITKHPLLHHKETIAGHELRGKNKHTGKRLHRHTLRNRHAKRAMRLHHNARSNVLDKIVSIKDSSKNVLKTFS